MFRILRPNAEKIEEAILLNIAEAVFYMIFDESTIKMLARIEDTADYDGPSIRQEAVGLDEQIAKCRSHHKRHCGFITRKILADKTIYEECKCLAQDAFIGIWCEAFAYAERVKPGNQHFASWIARGWETYFLNTLLFDFWTTIDGGAALSALLSIITWDYGPFLRSYYQNVLGVQECPLDLTDMPVLLTSAEGKEIRGRKDMLVSHIRSLANECNPFIGGQNHKLRVILQVNYTAKM